MHTQSTLDAFAMTRAALGREELGLFRARPTDMAAMTPTAPGAPVGPREPQAEKVLRPTIRFAFLGVKTLYRTSRPGVMNLFSPLNLQGMNAASCLHQYHSLPFTAIHFSIYAFVQSFQARS